MKRILYLFFLSFLLVSFTTYTYGDRSNDFSYHNKSKKTVLSPNPAKSFLLISCKEKSLKIKQIVITSILGLDVVYTVFNNPNSEVEVNLGKLTQGKYFVKVLYSDGSQDIEQLVKL